MSLPIHAGWTPNLWQHKWLINVYVMFHSLPLRHNLFSLSSHKVQAENYHPHDPRPFLSYIRLYHVPISDGVASAIDHTLLSLFPHECSAVLRGLF